MHRNGVDITVYNYKYSEGFFLLWCNGTDKTYKEEVGLSNVDNLEGDGFDINKLIEVIVPPYHESFYKFKKINQYKPFSMNLKTVNFWLDDE